MTIEATPAMYAIIEQSFIVFVNGGATITSSPSADRVAMANCENRNVNTIYETGY